MDLYRPKWALQKLRHQYFVVCNRHYVKINRHYVTILGHIDIGLRPRPLHNIKFSLIVFMYIYGNLHC